MPPEHARRPEALPGVATDAGREALAEWSALSDALLRGLVHALNNRLTALSAYAELSSMGDTDVDADIVLPAELTRLQQVGALFRLLASDDDGAEAMELAPVIDEALLLHSHHARLRAVRCDVVLEGTAIPLRVPRSALLRLLLTLLDAGKRVAEAAGRDVTTLRVTADERMIVLEGDALTVSPYAAVMAARCNGTVETRPGKEVVQLPNLLELRRRERERAAALSTA